MQRLPSSFRQANLAVIPLFLFFAVTMIPLAVWAASDAAPAEIQWMQMAMQLFGGLALFLFGMEQMSDSLKAVAGTRMRDILEKLTKNRFMGAITGAFITAVIQSSSVTTVLVVGFISAGLMTLTQSIGVIMGANIGTTITAQIVAFKVTKAAMLMIAIGFAMLFAGKKDKIKHYGAMLMGLGLIFFGMSIMSDAMKPLRTFQPFLDLMISMENPVIGILVAAAFTGLVQSSSATTGIVIAMASQGFITLPAGIALAFGANVGTCVTALLASIGKPSEARRAAMVHVIFNIAGVALWIAFIPWLAELVSNVSPAHAELSGADRLAAETPRQIANAHTIFNIANTFIFIWFAPQMAKLVTKLIPDREESAGVDKKRAKPRYLNEALISTPSLAIDSVRLEVLHIGEYVQSMLKSSMTGILKGDRSAIEQAKEQVEAVRELYRDSLGYLRKISKETLSEDLTQELQSLLRSISALESVSELIATRLVVIGEEKLDKNIEISPGTEERINELFAMVDDSLEQAIRAVSQENAVAANFVLEFKDEMDMMLDQIHTQQLLRFQSDDPNRVEVFALEDDLFETLRRIYSFARRMAKTVEESEAFYDESAEEEAKSAEASG